MMCTENVMHSSSCSHKNKTKQNKNTKKQNQKIKNKTKQNKNKTLFRHTLIELKSANEK